MVQTNKKLNKKAFIIKSSIIAVPSIYIGGILGQIMYFNQSSNFKNTPMLKFGLLDVLKFIFTNIYGLFGIALAFAGIYAGISYLQRAFGEDGGVEDERNFTKSDKGTYGTSGLMNEEERAKVLNIRDANDTDEIILGKVEGCNDKVITIPSDTHMNRHIAIYGASGTGKSRDFARPYIMQMTKRGKRLLVYKSPKMPLSHVTEYLDKHSVYYNLLKSPDGDYISIPDKKNTIINELTPMLKAHEFESKVDTGESMIITDPKGELYCSMAPWLKSQGYEVKVFNLNDLEHSDSWNCLEEIDGDDLNAQIFADVIITNTSGKANGDFWSQCEMNLLKALCLYVCINKDIPSTMSEVYNLVTTKKPGELDILFNELPFNDETQTCKAAYSIYEQASDNIKGGVLIGFGSKLQIFQGNVVRKMTGSKEIDLTLPAVKKCAYFCITSDQHSAFDFLAVLFYSMLFIKLVKFADTKGMGPTSPDGTSPIPVNFILDEFPNIGAIPDFCKKISTVRSRGLNITVIFQNIAQLQNRYPYGQWEEILGNCDTHLFLGCTDATTAKFISDRTGVMTVCVSSKAREKHFGAVINSLDYKENSSIGKRNVLTEDEVLRLDNSDELILLRGQKPYKCKKFDYSLHPDACKLTETTIAAHVPAWKAKPLVPDPLHKNQPKDNEPTDSIKPESKKTAKPIKEFPSDFIN